MFKIWLLEFQKDRIAITSKMFKFYIKELLTKQFANIYPNGKNFLASDQWFYHFLKRHRFALRRKTKIGQKLPAQLNDKLLKFQQSIIERRKKFEYELFEIENMDETPVFFDIIGNLTIEECDAKTVQI